jgi:hypothetical protein
VLHCKPCTTKECVPSSQRLFFDGSSGTSVVTNRGSNRNPVGSHKTPTVSSGGGLPETACPLLRVPTPLTVGRCRTGSLACWDVFAHLPTPCDTPAPAGKAAAYDCGDCVIEYVACADRITGMYRPAEHPAKVSFAATSRRRIDDVDIHMRINSYRSAAGCSSALAIIVILDYHITTAR